MMVGQIKPDILAQIASDEGGRQLCRWLSHSIAPLIGQKHAACQCPAKFAQTAQFSLPWRTSALSAC